MRVLLRFPIAVNRAMFAVLLALAITVAGLSFPEPSRASLPGAEAPTSLDPANPTANINDPVAGLAPVAADCKPGQVDVNTASKQKIDKALKLGEPTLSRVVAARPFLRSLDMISVPGVPTSSLAKLQSATCAEPVALPAPSPLACPSDTSAVDLQSASGAEISRTTGLDAEVAARIINARPLPQDLSQVAPPRIPGFALPTINRLLAEKKICVTPAPFNFRSVGWRWASHDFGATITAPGDANYALFVPAGVVSGAGTWGRVTPLPNDEFGKARADFHLVGPWSGQVAIRLPEQTNLSTEAAVVFHTRADGSQTVSTGDAVYSNGVNATSVAESLSEFDVTTIDCTRDIGQLASLFDCGSTTNDDTAEVLGRRSGSALVNATKSSFETSPCNDVNDRVHSDGAVPFGMSCGNDGGNGSRATWTLSNNTDAAVGIGDFTIAESTGVAFEIDVVRGPGGWSYNNPDPKTPGLDDIAHRWIADNLGIIVGGDNAIVSKAAGAAPTTLRIGIDPAKGALAWTIANAAGTVDSAWDIVQNAGLGPNMIQRFHTTISDGVENCAIDISINVLGGDAKEASKSFVNCLIESVLIKLTRDWDELDGRSREARRIKGAMKALKFASKWWGLLVNGMASGIATAAAGIDGTKDLTVWYDLPPSSDPFGGNGGTNPAGGWDGTIRNDTGDAGNVLVKLQLRIPGVEFPDDNKVWFIPPPNTVSPFGPYAMPVATTQDYYCLAHKYPLRDQLPRDRSGDYIALEAIDDDAGCIDGKAPRFDVAGNETNVILRQFAQGEGVAPAWFVDANSVMYPINDGGTYICLAQKYYVLDGRDDSEISKWTEAAVPATCS